MFGSPKKVRTAISSTAILDFNVYVTARDILNDLKFLIVVCSWIFRKNQCDYVHVLLLRSLMLRGTSQDKEILLQRFFPRLLHLRMYLCLKLCENPLRKLTNSREAIGPS